MKDKFQLDSMKKEWKIIQKEKFGNLHLQFFHNILQSMCTSHLEVHYKLTYNSINEIFYFQLLESVWIFLKGNITFAFNLVTTVLSIVFFSGAYLLNTGLSMVSWT